MKKMMLVFLAMVVMVGVGWAWDPGLPDLPGPDHPTLTLPQVKDHSYMMNVQGMVKNISDISGSTVADGSYPFTFVLKRNQIGADDLPVNWVDAGWTETITSVDVKNGIFNVALGKITALPLFNPKYSYALKITFRDDVMTAYQPLLSVPIAITARNLWGGGVVAKSTNAALPAIYGTNTAGGYGVAASGGVGVWGHSQDRPNLSGVLGTSNMGWGVVGMVSPEGKSGVMGMTTDAAVPTDANTGVVGSSKGGNGVYGQTNVGDAWKAGVYGYNANTSTIAKGVMGYSSGGRGVYGLSGGAGIGVMGETAGTLYGVYGNASGAGNSGTGVYGKTESTYGLDAGVYAYADKGAPALLAWQAGGLADKIAVYALAYSASDAINATASTGKAIIANNNSDTNPTVKINNDANGPALELNGGYLKMRKGLATGVAGTTVTCNGQVGRIRVTPDADDHNDYIMVKNDTMKSEDAIVLLTLRAPIIASDYRTYKICNYSTFTAVEAMPPGSGTTSTTYGFSVNFDRDLGQEVYVNFMVIN